MLKKSRTRNPFREYQRQRIERNTAKIKAAIDTLRNFKTPITYSAVARLTEMTLSGIRKNSHYVMLVETAKAQVSAHIQHSATPDEENPRTLDDALALLRILRAKNQSLARKVNLQARVFKRYNIHWAEGEFGAVPTTEQAARQLNEQQTEQQTELLRRIIRLILDDHATSWNLLAHRLGMFNSFATAFALFCGGRFRTFYIAIAVMLPFLFLVE